MNYLEIIIILLIMSDIIINVHHHYTDSSKEVLSKLDLIIKNQNKMATDLTELTTKVEENGTVIGSATILLKGLKDALDAAGTDPAKLKDLSNKLGSKTQELADAIVANTPAEEPPTP